jgi:hypothetical protein
MNTTNLDIPYIFYTHNNISLVPFTRLSHFHVGSQSHFEPLHQHILESRKASISTPLFMCWRDQV